ncbi:MAG: choice-of-anchor D domain-containing protein [Solirubrobacterales bacterium]
MIRRVLAIAALGMLCSVSLAKAETTPPSCKVEDPSGKEVCRTKLPGAEFKLSPATYSFGTRGLDLGASSPAAFVLTNTGKPLLTVGLIKLSWSDPEGADPELFAIDSNNCGTLGPGESCTIKVTFNPILPGLKQGTLTVVDTTQSASAVTELEGSGRVVVLSPPSLAFGVREVGRAAAAPQQVTVINTSQYEPITLYGMTLVGEQQQDASQFRITGGSCEAELIIPPRGSCAVDVTFLPSAMGSHQASLQVLDSAPEVQQSSALKGEGVLPILPPPRGFVIRHPARRTTKRAAMFEFSGNSAARVFECRLDKHPFARCESPISFHRLRTGQHSFEVQAVDTADGESSEVIRYLWKVTPRRR